MQVDHAGADTPVAEVVDISTAAQLRTAQDAAAGVPVVIDDSDHLLPHERTEGSASLTLDPTSPYADPSASLGATTLADVIVDERIGRRAWWRRFVPRRISPLAGFGMLIGVFALTLVVLASPLFGVRRIEVTGVTYADPTLLESVSDSLRGASVFTADLDGAQRRLEGDRGWLERDCRGTCRIVSRSRSTSESRSPLVRRRRQSGPRTDFEGRVLAVLDGQPTQFMKIEGVGPNLPPGTVPSLVYQAAAQLAVSLPESLAPRVKHVTVSGPESLGFTLKSGTEVTLGAPTDIRNKLISVLTVLNQQNVDFITGIDVSAGQPVVKND